LAVQLIDPRRAAPPVASRQIRITLAVSLLLHALLLAILATLHHRPGPPGPPQEPGFQMMFDTSTPNAVPVPGNTIQAPNGATTAPSHAGEQTAHEPQVNLFSPDDFPAPPPPQQQAFAEPAPLPSPPRPPVRRPRHVAGANAQAANPFGTPLANSFNQQTTTLPPGVTAATGTTLSMGNFARGGQASEATAHISMPGAEGDYDNMLFEYAANHLHYPEQAASNDESGTVIIKVKIARDGTVKDVRLLKSSIYRILDLNTMDVYRNKKMPPLPDYITGPEHDFTLAVEYDLIYQ
jgi:periplasmic protein TonB